MYWVIDADVTAYFDTIPHDRLMKTVAQRVVDRAMLALVKRFLEAPVIDDRDDGRPHRTRQGTPQGGVISPLAGERLLAPARPELPSPSATRGAARATRPLCGRFRPAVAASSRPSARVAAAADDATRLDAAPGQDARARCATRRLRVSRAYASMAVQSAVPRRQSEGVATHPRRTAAEDAADVVESRRRWWRELNPYIRGARHYFRRVRRRTLGKLDGFVNQRLARWWARKHGPRRPAWSLVSQDALRCHHGLERWNLPAALRPADSRFAR